MPGDLSSKNVPHAPSSANNTPLSSASLGASVKFLRADAITLGHLEKHRTRLEERGDDSKIIAFKLKLLNQRVFRELGPAMVWQRVVDESIPAEHRGWMLNLYANVATDAARTVPDFIRSELAKNSLPDQWLLRVAQLSISGSKNFDPSTWRIEHRVEILSSIKQHLERIYSSPISPEHAGLLRVLYSAFALHGALAPTSESVFLASLADERTPPELRPHLCRALKNLLWPYRDYPEKEEYRTALKFLAKEPMNLARETAWLDNFESESDAVTFIGQCGQLAGLASRISAADGKAMLEEMSKLPFSGKFAFACVLAIHDGLPSEIIPIHGPAKTIPESLPWQVKDAIGVILPSFIEAQAWSDSFKAARSGKPPL
jgi:hypothetical protein